MAKTARGHAFWRIRSPAACSIWRRELLGKFTHDSSLPRAIRDGAGRALRGDGTLRDVLELPEFSELRQRVAERFAEEMAEKTPEERDQISAALRAQYAGPYGTPTREDER